MTTKETILNNIAKNRPASVELPEYDFTEESSTLFEDFKASIQGVGGDAIIIKKEDLAKTIKELFPKAEIIASTTSFFQGTLDLEKIEKPQELANVDLVVAKGEFGVAENGAVWVQNPKNTHRGLYFIAENIILVVEKEKIFHNMHSAYEQISFENSTYGTFISGPSKTADIEQSLVIGAHGPKQGIVLFIS